MVPIAQYATHRREPSSATLRYTGGQFRQIVHEENLQEIFGNLRVQTRTGIMTLKQL